MATLVWVWEAINFHAVNTTLWMLIPVLVLFVIGLWRITFK